MSADESGALTRAAARIAAAYDPDQFRTLGHRLADILAEHLKSVQHSSGVVLNSNPPGQLVAEAGAFLMAPAASREEAADRFSELVKHALSRGHNLHDPRYIGHQVPAPVPIAGWFEALAAVTNQPMAIFEMGPWATAVENALVNQLLETIGWSPAAASGFVTHGASLANLTALITARNLALPQSWQQGLSRQAAAPVLLAQSDAHYCIARAAGILGLGTDNIVKVPLDSRRRMDVTRLAELIAEYRRKKTPIVAVVACAGATPTGAFDPLADVAAVCQSQNVWLHIDGAHGAAALMSERHRHLLDGVSLADSVTWDAHKMLFVPALCAFLFYKQRRHAYATFQQNAPYLFDTTGTSAADYDSGLRTLECTKRAAAFGLWGVWSLLGRQIFADLVDVTFALTHAFYEKLREAPDFVPLHEPQCNIQVFRHVPAALRDAPPEVLGRWQLRVRQAVVESGEFYLVSTVLDGQPALRTTLINPLTTPAHLDALLAAIRRVE